MHITSASGLAMAALVLAGCAGQPANPAPGPGPHLVYRDNAGAPIRQFSYPTDDFCRRVETAAGRSARCQDTPVASAQLAAQATLRYNPPGVLVHAHYADMARCRQETGALGPGVELINACKAK